MLFFFLNCQTLFHSNSPFCFSKQARKRWKRQQRALRLKDRWVKYLYTYKCRLCSRLAFFVILLTRVSVLQKYTCWLWKNRVYQHKIMKIAQNIRVYEYWIYSILQMIKVEVIWKQRDNFRRTQHGEDGNKIYGLHECL